MRLSDMRHEITRHEIAGQARNDARLSPLSFGEGSGVRLIELKAKPLKEANMDNPLQAQRGSGKSVMACLTRHPAKKEIAGQARNDGMKLFTIYYY